MSRKLTERQRLAVYFVVRGTTHREVARRIRVRPETLSRWKKLPEFQQECEDLMDQMQAEMRQRLLMMGALAIEAVTDGLKTYKTGAQTGLKVLKLFGIDQLLTSHAPVMLRREQEIITNS